MPAYELTAQRTSSSTASVASVVGTTATLRRARIYSATFSSEATPAEVAILWQIQRVTAAGTSTAVTPKPKDLADAASGETCGQVHTIEPTYTSGEIMYSNAVHQRATVRWIARDDADMIVLPATNAAGIGVKTPTLNGGTPVITLDLGWIE
jgi:hypothetical protein